MEDDSLQKVILEALRNYNDLEALRHSPLSSMAAIWPLPPSTSPVVAASIKGLAVRRLLERVVARFSETDPNDAGMIAGRFFGGKLIKAIEASASVPSTTYYNRLRRALPILARIMTEMEVEAQRNHHYETLAKTASLPSPTYERLVGVDFYLERLWEALNAGLREPGLPIVVTGLGGIGKTSLVSEALRSWVRQVSPPIQKVLFAAFGKTVGQSAAHSLDALLFRLGDQLNLPLHALPDAERRLALMIETLAQAPHTIVLDNIEREDEVEQARCVMDALAPVAQILITSRHTFDGANVRSIVLGELPRACALELLQLEALRLEYAPPDEAAAQSILRKVGGHPLALKLVAGLMSRLPVEQVLASLANPTGKTQEMFQDVYATAWGLLSPTAQSILQALILLPAEGANWQWLQIGAQIEDEPVDDATLTGAVNELATLNLLQVSRQRPPIYSLHRLTYRFLAQKAGWDVEDEV